MDFNKRCERFKKNTEKETNIFKYVYRVVFLKKKIQEHEKEELGTNDLRRN